MVVDQHRAIGEELSARFSLRQRSTKGLERRDSSGPNIPIHSKIAPKRC